VDYNKKAWYDKEWKKIQLTKYKIIDNNGMNSHNTSTGLQRYGQTIAAWLLKFFAWNINAQLQNPEPSELEAVTPIESPLKFVREISIDQYMSERLNWIRLMDMVTHAEWKRNSPIAQLEE
jgi:hypothetical protein